jgi:hypothetical protein
MNRTTSVIALSFFLGGSAFAQYQVNDSGTQAAIANLTGQTAQNQTSILQQWTTSFGKLDSQITKLNSLVQVAGNPQAALGAIGGSGNLGSIGTTLSQAGQLGNQIMQTANGGRSLLSNGQGAFKSIPSSLSNGLPIPRDTTSYNKFDAYEQNFQQLNTTLQQCQSTRQNLLSELQSTLAVTPSDASQQQAQLIKVNAINAELQANDQQMKQIQSQTTAQHEANIQDQAKQQQASTEAAAAAENQGLSNRSSGFLSTVQNQ